MTRVFEYTIDQWKRIVAVIDMTGYHDVASRLRQFVRSHDRSPSAVSVSVSDQVAIALIAVASTAMGYHLGLDGNPSDYSDWADRWLRGNGTSPAM